MDNALRHFSTQDVLSTQAQCFFCRCQKLMKGEKDMRSVDNGRTIPDSLIAAIYDGTLNDAPWQIALGMLKTILDAEWATLRLIAHNPPLIRETNVGPLHDYSAEINAIFVENHAAEFIPPNLRAGMAVITDWEESRLPSSSLEWKQKFGLDTSITVCIEVYEKSKCVLQIIRSRARGRFSKADLEFAKRIGGHFGRAISLRRKAVNAMATSEFQADALNKFGIGGILVAPDRTLTILNRAAEDIVSEEDGLKFVGGRLVATDSTDDSKLQRAISNALAGEAQGTESYGLTVKRRGSRRAIGVVVNSRPYRPLIASGIERCAIIFVRNPEFLTLADTKLMQQLFGFTPAEAKLAIYLTSGMHLEDIESTLNICHNTARAHLRSMYQKAHVNSQAELIQLLSSCAAPLGRQEHRETMTVS